MCVHTLDIDTPRQEWLKVMQTETQIGYDYSNHATGGLLNIKTRALIVVLLRPTNKWLAG